MEQYARFHTLANTVPTVRLTQLDSVDAQQGLNLLKPLSALKWTAFRLKRPTGNERAL